MQALLAAPLARLVSLPTLIARFSFQLGINTTIFASRDRLLHRELYARAFYTSRIREWYADCCLIFFRCAPCLSEKAEASTMLHYAFLFLIVALVSALLGFWGIAGVAANIAKILFVVFLVLFCITLLFGYAVI
jgi:uncharacterized membrane protein YtjA (UPF0391 family)